MSSQRKQSSGIGLERSCAEASGDWLSSDGPDDGVEWLEAWFSGRPYARHRHDTYAICLTTRGVQGFTYRGATEISLPGQVVVLHPDETHDGYAATEAGFGYRQLYIEPALIFAAVESLQGRPGALPFVRTPVVSSAELAAAVEHAFAAPHEPLALDSVVLRIAEGLLAADPSAGSSAVTRQLDVAALQRAQGYLDAEKTRVVRSDELEAVTGLTRYELARQFRVMFGTSPYRYVLLRRLDHARTRLSHDPATSLAAIAYDSGFADQPHFTRAFKATYGLTPARYRALG